METSVRANAGLTFAFKATAAIIGLKIAIVLLAPQAAIEAPSNYAAWGLSDAASWNDAIRFLVRGGLLAPIAEEAIFRGGMLGGLWGILVLWRVPNAWAFWIAALPVSALFVGLHETSNALFILIRMTGAIALAWVYRSAGLRGAVLMHALGNSFWAALIIADRFFGYDGMTMVLSLGAAAGYSISRLSNGPKPADGEASPRLRATDALGLALALSAGSILYGGSPLYSLAAIGLASFAAARGLSGLRTPALEGAALPSGARR
jgi:membrane protease YdiL (CAAX protease family)